MPTMELVHERMRQLRADARRAGLGMPVAGGDGRFRRYARRIHMGR